MRPDIEAFLTDFLSEIVAGNAAIFAGAGLSIPAGFVDWRELTRPLMVEIGLDPDIETDFVAAAQFHVNANGSNRHTLHHTVIDSLSKLASPTENHQLLAKLPIATWWTTNFDKLIEDSLRGSNKIVDVKSATPQLAVTRPGREVTLFKMHGDVDRPEEAVATKDDYERYEKVRGAFTNALAGDLVSKTFLFLGFSFTDPNLEQVLSRVRLTFSSNQRRHYAIFRNRVRLPNEEANVFDHYRARQALVIEDLKRFNIKVLLVDEFSEITEILRELLRRFRRRTIFVSGSAEDFSPWGASEVSKFTQKLGQAIVSRGSRLATGLGVGIGDSIFTGALREILRTGGRVDDTLILRPFPQGATSAEEREQMWDSYRNEILSHAGIAIFLFGNKKVGRKTSLADGVEKEFRMAISQGVITIPVGATGFAAEDLAAQSLREPEKFLTNLNSNERAVFESLSAPRDSLNWTIDPLLNLIRMLQKVS